MKTHKKIVDTAFLAKREVELESQIDILTQLKQQIDHRTLGLSKELWKIQELQKENLKIARQEVQFKGKR